MPKYPCKSGLACGWLDAPGFCARHAHLGAKLKRDWQQHYDRHLRDHDAKAFYDGPAWARARSIKLAANAVCEYPGCAAYADHVHHVTPVAELATTEARCDQSNLMSLCVGHHNVMEAQSRRGIR